MDGPVMGGEEMPVRWVGNMLDIKKNDEAMKKPVTERAGQRDGVVVCLVAAPCIL